LKKIYHGSCHCGAVAYEAGLDLSAGTFKCNCSICRKKRSWLAVVQPDDFRLVSGEDRLRKYQFASGSIQHLFCENCGVASFARNDNETIGPLVVVAVSCLDDASTEELAAAPVAYFDGLHDRYDAEPAEKRLL
jgi:hypothetical protein